MATDDATRTLAHAAQLLERLRGLRAQTDAVTDELLKLLRGEVKEFALTAARPKPNGNGSDTKGFLEWFQAEYRQRRHGADYLVQWEKDGAIVKRLLAATELERLKKLAQILLSDKTEEEFIVNSDRGIGVLVVKFNWLSDRLAAYEQRQRQRQA